MHTFTWQYTLCCTDRGLWPWGVHHLTFDPVFTNEEVCDYSVHNHSEPGAQALCKGVVCVKWSVYLLLWPQSGQVGLVPSSVWRGLEKQRAEAWVFGLGRRAGCLGDAEGKQQDLTGALWSQSLVRPERGLRFHSLTSLNLKWGHWNRNWNKWERKNVEGMYTVKSTEQKWEGNSCCGDYVWHSYFCRPALGLWSHVKGENSSNRQKRDLKGAPCWLSLSPCVLHSSPLPSLQGFPGVWTAAGQRDHGQTPGEERPVKEIVSRQQHTGKSILNTYQSVELVT